MTDGLKRQIRREELAMRIANGFEADPALDIIEAVLAGARVISFDTIPLKWAVIEHVGIPIDDEEEL